MRTTVLRARRCVKHAPGCALIVCGWR